MEVKLLWFSQEYVAVGRLLVSIRDSTSSGIRIAAYE